MKTARLILAIAPRRFGYGLLLLSQRKKECQTPDRNHLAMVDGKDSRSKPTTTIRWYSAKKKGRFGGRGDCNSIMGNYTLSDNGKIKIESVASTRAMCANQAQEDKFIKELDRVDSYRIDGDLLMLMHDGEMLMVMQAQDTAMK